MTCDQAIEAAKLNRPVLRPHWYWVKLCYSPVNSRLFLDYEDGERKGWRPTKENQKATDWGYADARQS